MRLGDVAILYVSPEQLRNRSLRGVLHSREIGCWVFDEAHCLSHFQVELGQSLDLFKVGVGRDNLRFEVRLVDAPSKLATVATLLREALGPAGGMVRPGSAIVYFATRSATVEAAEYLCNEGLLAEPFHAGLDAPLKQFIQEAFLAGAVPITFATNAFGMGIDKPDVRLVVHADVPGTLENYLQEAGRAGRDRREAHCVLLYAAPDVEKQFRLLARA